MLAGLALLLAYKFCLSITYYALNKFRPIKQAIVDYRAKIIDHTNWMKYLNVNSTELSVVEYANFWPDNAPILMKQSDFDGTSQSRLDGLLNFLESKTFALSDAAVNRTTYPLAFGCYYLNAWNSIFERDGIEKLSETPFLDYTHDTILELLAQWHPSFEAAYVQAFQFYQQHQEEMKDECKAAAEDDDESTESTLSQRFKQLEKNAYAIYNTAELLLDFIAKKIADLPNLMVVPDQLYEAKMAEFLEQATYSQECLSFLEKIIPQRL